MQLLGPIMKSVVGNPPTYWEQNHLSEMKTYGNTNNFSNAERTLDRNEFGNPLAGDMLVAVILRAGYSGESSGFLLTPTFQAWSNQISGTQHTASDTSEFTASLWAREASGDEEDDCLLGSNGPFPSGFQVLRLSGNPFTWPGTVIADNETDEDLVDAAGLIREGNMFGGFNNCIEFFASTKRATALQSVDQALDDPSYAGLTVIGIVDSIDNGFDQGIVGIWGWQYSENSVDRAPVGNWGGAEYTSESFAVGVRWKTNDS